MTPDNAANHRQENNRAEEKGARKIRISRFTVNRGAFQQPTPGSGNHESLNTGQAEHQSTYKSSAKTAAHRSQRPSHKEARREVQSL